MNPGILLQRENLLVRERRTALGIPFVELHGEDIPAIGKGDVVIGGKFPRLLEDKHWRVLRGKRIAHCLKALKGGRQVQHSVLALHGLKGLLAYSWHDSRIVGEIDDQTV